MRKTTATRWHLALVVGAMLLASCTANQEILRSGAESPTPATTVSTPPPIDQEIRAMQTAGFSYILVLRRKDGAPMDAADKAVIRKNTANANRRISAEDDRAFVIGSNYAMEPANVAALFAYFAVEDRSETPISVPPANAANSNANTSTHSRKPANAANSNSNADAHSKK